MALVWIKSTWILSWYSVCVVRTSVHVARRHSCQFTFRTRWRVPRVSRSVTVCLQSRRASFSSLQRCVPVAARTVPRTTLGYLFLPCLINPVHGLIALTLRPSALHWWRRAQSDMWVLCRPADPVHSPVPPGDPEEANEMPASVAPSLAGAAAQPGAAPQCSAPASLLFHLHRAQLSSLFHWRTSEFRDC